MKKHFITALILCLLALGASSCKKGGNQSPAAKKPLTSIDKQLIAAVKSGNVAKVRELLAGNANPNSKTKGVTPLVWASYKGWLGIVKLLLAKGADINMRDKDGDTALIAAVFGGKPHVVNYLVSKGAKLDVTNHDGKTALHAAYVKNQAGIIKFLLTKMSDLSDTDKFFLAIESNNMALVLKYLNSGISPSTQSNHPAFGPGTGDTALVAAVKKGRYEIAKLLIEKGADVNTSIFRYTTALYAAVSNNDIRMAKLLLDSGANINYGTEGGITGDGFYGKTCLMEAAENGHIRLVRFLIERGADVNKKASAMSYLNEPGKAYINFNALMYAEEKKHRVIARILINAGAKRIKKYSGNSN